MKHTTVMLKLVVTQQPQFGCCLRLFDSPVDLYPSQGEYLHSRHLVRSIWCPNHNLAQVVLSCRPDFSSNVIIITYSKVVIGQSCCVLYPPWGCGRRFAVVLPSLLPPVRKSSMRFIYFKMLNLEPRLSISEENHQLLATNNHWEENSCSSAASVRHARQVNKPSRG